MLTLIEGIPEKKSAQRLLKRALAATLSKRVKGNIGFPGGNTDETIHYSGEAGLWVAFGGPMGNTEVQRYWNAFGLYRSDRAAQTITVEINIPIESNTTRVAGFFARDERTGKIYLMHTGRIGGGQKGVGKSAFLAWSTRRLHVVSTEGGRVQEGILIGNLGDRALAERINAFVRDVEEFKLAARDGGLKTAEFRRRVAEYDRYRREFSGRKKGYTKGYVEYETYHGDVVDALRNDLSARLHSSEEIFNSPLIDLYVKRGDRISAVYEVKTSGDRSSLYAAVGQVLTHSTLSKSRMAAAVARFLVLPAEVEIPQDISRAMDAFGIECRRFRLKRGSRKSVVTLL